MRFFNTNLTLRGQSVLNIDFPGFDWVNPLYEFFFRLGLGLGYGNWVIETEVLFLGDHSV